MQEKTDNIALIIIDQFREDYQKHLKKCSSLLTHNAICHIDSFPASTESAHGTISSGEQPKIHGFISKTAKGGVRGLDQLIMKLRRKELPSLGSLGLSHGFKVYAIGGKEETIQVMGDDEDCELKVYYKKERLQSRSRFIHQTENMPLHNFLERLLSKGEYRNIPQEIWDRRVLEIFEHIEPMTRLSKRFFILTLSSLDKVGHDHGPNSAKVKEYLGFLDDRLYDLMKDREGSIIITGDHGCRTISRYILEPPETVKDALKVYSVDGDSIKFCEEHVLESFSKISDIQYDGGILRMWFKGKAELSDNDLSFFSKYGYVFPHYIRQKDADEEIVRLYENSRHENLGDILVVARGDAMFCKLGWIKSPIREKIAEKAILSRGELPIGEHGTHHTEDREVCFLSNSHVNDKISNAEIYGYIESLIR